MGRDCAKGFRRWPGIAGAIYSYGIIIRIIHISFSVDVLRDRHLLAAALALSCLHAHLHNSPRFVAVHPPVVDRGCQECSDSTPKSEGETPVERACKTRLSTLIDSGDVKGAADTRCHNCSLTPDIPVRPNRTVVRGFYEFLMCARRAFGDATFEEERGSVQWYR